MKRTARSLLAAPLLVLVGCLDAPPLEERWTRIDLRSVDRAENGLVVRGEVTFRSIRTGFLAAELRRVDPDSGAFHLHREGSRKSLSDEVAILLARSRVEGGASRAVTGWDHLIQPFSFDLPLPAGGAGDLYVALFLGEGERRRLGQERDTLVVRPWNADSIEVLLDAALVQAGEAR